MASRTRVVLNLVGPYTLYGRPVIEACVAGGAHYVDLTGEIPFVRQMIDAYDARAREAGVKVVQVCGFEALPPDLAVLLAAETARERCGEGLAEADLEVSVEGPPGLPRPSDMLSGGTLQSLAAAAGGENAAAVADPAALITDPALAAEVRRRSPITVAPRRGARRRGDRADGAGGVHQPGRDPAHGGAGRGRARRRARSRSATARASRSEGGAVTLPLRYAAAGALSGTQAAVLAAARARPSVRRRVGKRARAGSFPRRGSARPASASRQWKWRMSVEARTAGGHDGAGRRRRRRPPGLPGDGADAGRGRAAAGGARRDARARRLPDARDGARHRIGGTLRASAGAVLGRWLSRHQTQQVVEDPACKQRFSFERTVEDGGEVLLVEMWVDPGGGVPPHVHPAMEERFEVQSRHSPSSSPAASGRPPVPARRSSSRPARATPTATGATRSPTSSATRARRRSLQEFLEDAAALGRAGKLDEAAGMPKSFDALLQAAVMVARQLGHGRARVPAPSAARDPAADHPAARAARRAPRLPRRALRRAARQR